MLAVLVPILPYVLIAVLLAVLAVLVVLAMVMLRHRAVPPQEAAAAGAAPGNASALSPTMALQLRRSFARALKLLKAYVAGRDYRYRIPWFLLVGEVAAGKTTLLSHTGLSLPFGTPEGDTGGRQEGCTWWFFDQGIVLDIAGDYVLRADASPADTRGWHTLLRLLQRHRPARPINGVIVALPCTDLIGPPEQSPARVTQATRKAAVLYERLWQAQRVLGLRFPVYVLVTKCDQISGFQSFCAALPARLQQDMFGWSSPYTLETAYASHWVDEAFAVLSGQLANVQVDIMAEGGLLQDSDAFFLFPSVFQTIREPLRAYLDQLFAPSAYHEAFLCRGFYFCGDGRLEAPTRALPTASGATTESSEIPGLEPIPTPMTAHASALPGPAASVRVLPVFVRTLLAEKVFPEHGLAQPVARTLMTRNRTVLAVQVLTASIVLVWGLGIWLGYNRLAREEAVLQPLLRDINTTLVLHSKEKVESSIFEKAVNLLKKMSKIDRDTFSSPFFPSSWFDGIQYKIEEALTQAYNKIIFRSMLLGLKDKIQSAISNSSLPKANGTAGDVKAVETLPEFLALGRFVEELVGLETHIALYNNLQVPGSDDLRSLGQMVKYLFGIDLPAEFYEHTTLYRDALAQAGGQPLSISAYKEAATTQVLVRTKSLYDRVFASPMLLTSLSALAQALDRVKRQSPAEVSVRMLRDVLSMIDQTQAWLKPESGALTCATLAPVEPMNRLLTDIEKSAFLGPEVSEKVKKYCEAALQKFQAGLQAQKTSVTGALLQQDGGGDLELAPSVQTLKAALERFVTLEFVRREPQRRMRTDLIPKTSLIWDVRLLKEASKLYAPFADFRSEALKNIPREMARQVEAVAIRQLEANLSDLIAQAQMVVPTPEGFGLSRLEAGLGPEIRTLQEAAPDLGRVVDIFNEAGLGHESWALLTLVTEQAYRLLEMIDQLLESEQPYAIKNGNFAWWNGAAAPFLGAFEVRDTKELAARVTLQRERMKYFADTYAKPLVTLLINRPRQRTQRQEGLLAKWQGILTELEAYDNKKPGNSVATLETFVLQETEQVNAQNCLQSLTAPPPGESGSDFFALRLASLRREMYTRCQVITQEVAVREYARLAQMFNQRLAGKFPFVAGEDTSVEADPQAIRDFYRVFDQAAKTARGLLPSSIPAAITREQALTFLDQAEAARAFFAPFLDGEAQSQDPVFDVAVDFRVNRSRERGGNQIIDWSVLLGEQHVRARDAERQGRWRYGEPVRVALRWARDAIVTPVANGAEASVEVKESTVIYAYTNRWALLHLLRNRASAVTDFDRFVDPKPHTLKFVIETRPKQVRDGPPAATDGTETKVFIGVTVMAPGKKEALVLPLLPVRAPELLTAARR